MHVETEHGPTAGSTVAVEHGVHTERVLVVGTSWGAIWAGFFVALAVEFILSMLMVGVFASMVHPGGGSPSGKNFGFGMAVWVFVQTLIAYYCGGFVAGRARLGATNALTGAAVWGITTVALVYVLVLFAGSATSGIVDVVRGAFGIAAASTQLPGVDTGTAAGQIATQAGPSATGTAAVAIATWVPIYFFFTLLLSFGTAVWGACTPRRVT